MKEQSNKGTKEQQNNRKKEQRNKGTKEQKNKRTKEPRNKKVHPIGYGITRSPGLVFINLRPQFQNSFVPRFFLVFFA
jgi:hypothetical protein